MPSSPQASDALSHLARPVIVSRFGRLAVPDERLVSLAASPARYLQVTARSRKPDPLVLNCVDWHYGCSGVVPRTQVPSGRPP